MEILAGFTLHHGPRMSGGAIRIQLHGNQPSGIHFKVEPSEIGYRRGIEKGLREGVEANPSLKSMAIWVVEVQEHPVDSSENAFYRVALLAIEEVLALKRIIAESK